MKKITGLGEFAHRNGNPTEMNKKSAVICENLRPIFSLQDPEVSDGPKDPFSMLHSYRRTALPILILAVFLSVITKGVAQPVRVQLPAEAIGDPGSSVVIPIEVGTLTDRDVIAYEADVSFDANVIQATGASSSGTISGSFGPPIVNLLEEGKIRVAGFGTSPLNGEGVLVNILFEVVGQLGDTTTLTFDNFVFNSGDPAVETLSGKLTISFPTAIDNGPDFPLDFSVAQNYPNPFNPSTVIAFQIPPGWHTPVLLRIFNVRGQLISTLVDGVMPPGAHQVRWDGKNQQGRPVPSGSYLYQLASGSMMVSKKMQLIR